jgi:hypothetical protein
MTFLVIVVVAVLLAGAIVLAVVVISVRLEDRYLSLRNPPATCVDAFVRRLLGAGRRQPEDASHSADQNRTVHAGRDEQRSARTVRAPLPVRGARGGRPAPPMREVLSASALAPPQGPARRRAAPGAAARGIEAPMTVTIPLVLILAVVVFLAYRYMGLRVWQAVVCLLCGFLLAATTAAPDIQQALNDVVLWLTGRR